MGLTSSGQQDAAGPPIDVPIRHAASQREAAAHDESDDDFVPRGLSDTQAVLKAEKHVKHRIVAFIKSTIFRKIKFITSDRMFRKAFKYVLEFEQLTDPQKCFKFTATYESSFNRALNSKTRSSCEQAAGVVVRKSMGEMKKNGDQEFYTIDELCKLRRAETEREKEAFYWFMSEFMECICGVRLWKHARRSMLISDAKDVAGCKIVTKSDEAFGLLLIDNYMEKWKRKLVEEEGERVEEGSDSANEERSDTVPKRKRVEAKYTTKRKGNTCKYGGWSMEGMTRFNELYDIVKKDRASPKAKEMEESFRMHCRTLAGKHCPNGNSTTVGELDGNNAAQGDTEVEVLAVEAAWDSENDQTLQWSFNCIGA